MLSCLSHVQLFAILWTVACWGPQFMGFARQENWSGLPCPPPGDLSDPGIKLVSPTSPALQADFWPLSHRGRLFIAEVKWKSLVVSDSATHGLYSPWDSPGQNTGVGSLSLLQGIFPTRGSNPGLLHCKWILLLLSHPGSPRILEWVACPFSKESSQPRT